MDNIWPLRLAPMVLAEAAFLLVGVDWILGADWEIGCI